MKTNLEQLHEQQQKLRADQSAATMVLQCLLTVLTPEQQKQAMAAFAQMTVAREEFAERLPIQAAREAEQQVQEAAKRMYQALEGAHKSRMSKLREG